MFVAHGKNQFRANAPKNRLGPIAVVLLSFSLTTGCLIDAQDPTDAAPSVPTEKSAEALSIGGVKPGGSGPATKFVCNTSWCYLRRRRQL